MEQTSRSYNYATRKFEIWGIDNDGHATYVNEPEDEQLELQLPPPVPKHPPNN